MYFDIDDVGEVVYGDLSDDDDHHHHDKEA